MSRTLVLLIALVFCCAALPLTGCESSNTDSTADSKTTSAPATDQDNADDAQSDDQEGNAGSDQASATDEATPDDPAPTDDGPVAYVRIKTNKGDIYVGLNREKAPIATRNFLTYAEQKFYDNTLFHRVMANFMIQGGGFTTDMVKKQTNPPIENEWQNGLTHERGSIAMARGGPILTSQFFINVVDNSGDSGARLDRPQRDGAGYAVFGKVVGGMDVVDAIRAVRVSSAMVPGEGRPRQNVPVEKVIIESVRQIGVDEVVFDA